MSSGEAELNPQQWAQAVLDALDANKLTAPRRSLELKPVFELASKYLTHLLVAGMF